MPCRETARGLYSALLPQCACSAGGISSLSPDEIDSLAADVDTYTIHTLWKVFVVLAIFDIRLPDQRKSLLGDESLTKAIANFTESLNIYGQNHFGLQELFKVGVRGNGEVDVAALSADISDVCASHLAPFVVEISGEVPFDANQRSELFRLLGVNEGELASRYGTA